MNIESQFYVEDTYDQIYKIAYLKLNGIKCNFDNFEELYNNNSKFVLRRTKGATHLAGRLRSKSTDGYKDKKIVGLFDFDRAGLVQFHNLKKEPFWKRSVVQGDVETGFFKK